MELNKTIEMMTSADYKERFKAEFYQLKIRICKLDNMVSKYKLGECSRGERHQMIAFVCNEDGQWYHIRLNDGKTGFVKADDADAVYTFNN